MSQMHRLKLMACIFVFALTAGEALAQVPKPASPSPMSAAASSSGKEAYQRKCIQADLLGLWKLVNVTEEPKGELLAGFVRSPHQYVSFEATSVYGEEAGLTEYQDSGKLIDVIRRNGKQYLLQFLINEEGAIYFYKNRAATGMASCTFITGDHDFFRIGDIVLGNMDKNVPTQFWKLYRKPAFAEASAPTVPPGQNAKKKKAKKKKKARKRPARRFQR